MTYVVSDPIDEMRLFVKGLSNDLPEDCHSSMLHENMNISFLIVYTKKVKEARSKRNNTDTKRARSF